MPAFLDTTVKEIDRRLAELKDELSKLEAARQALAEPRQSRSQGRGSSTSSASRQRRRAAPRQRRATSGRRRGHRSAQALELVGKQPGITVAELADRMKIHPSGLYRILPNLAAEGQVKREGRGWHRTT